MSMNVDPIQAMNMDLPDLDTMSEGDMVGLYVALRDAKAIVKKKMKEQIHRHINVKMDALTAKMLGRLDVGKLKGISSDYGTAYRIEEASATIADKEVFRDYVTGNKIWDLIDWRANKTYVRGLVEANQPVPPGLNYSTRYTIGVRRASES